MNSVDGAASVEFERGGRGARDRIIATAIALFYRNGIHATGMDRIAQHAHVSKRTLYQHFATKDELVQAYLRTIDSTRAIPNEQALTTPGLSARSRLLTIFDSAPETRVRGCPFHNAAVEAAGEWPRVHDIVHKHKLAFIASLIETCTELGVDDPHQLGHQLAVVFEGGIALATTLNDTSPMIYGRLTAETLIDQAMRPVPSRTRQPSPKKSPPPKSQKRPRSDDGKSGR
jgi:AcrR family transcriptional regulator